MKTSFYFVIWIVIYPILGLFHNSIIEEHSFFIALVAVWGLSWLLNRTMPETLTYEHVSQVAPVMEDIYTGNVSSFSMRIAGTSAEEGVGSLYFIVTSIVLAYVTVFMEGGDWFALLIFVFFAIGSISRFIQFFKAGRQIKQNPTPQECMAVASRLYQLDYEAYYNGRQNATCEQMLPSRPPRFKAFMVVSTVIAVIAGLLGLGNIVLGAIIMLSESSFAVGALAGMYFLYGSLALYFGIKDSINCIRTLKSL